MVNVGEFVVPLIGLPVDCRLGECECCGNEHIIDALKFSEEGQLLCPRCEDKNRP